MEDNKYTVGEDDGSLAFLNIAPDPDNKFFNCDTVKQMALANRTFWVTGFVEGVITKFKKEGGQTKPKSEFYYIQGHGTSWMCKECSKEYARQQRAKVKLNKENT